jgi:hypothetical protein
MADEKNFSVDTEQLKNETKDTVNQVKDTIKNTDFKKDAAETKGFLKEMLANPFETVKKVATGEESVLSKAVIIMIVFIAASVAYKIISLIKYGKYSGIGSNILGFVASILNPIFYILVPAVIILIMNKENKKSLITVITTLVITSTPVVINYIIDIIEILVSGITIISSPISTMFSAIALVLTYFGMKDIFGVEEDGNFIKKYAIIKVLAAFVLVILSRVGIY